MSAILRIFFFGAVFFLSTGFAISLSGKLVKAFEALEVYNYFEAKDLFYKSMKKDSLAASYGLSVIYGRNDNPFYQLDSAYKYIRISKEHLSQTEHEKWEELATVGLDSMAVVTQLLYVDSCFYTLALISPSVKKWDSHIVNHQSQPYLDNAISNRNAMAFEIAQSIDSATAYQAFCDTYPNAEEYQEAQLLFELRLYQEFVTSGSLEAFQAFVINHPDSPHFKDAELNVYELYTKDDNLDSYNKFISENPNNSFVEKAWRQVYALEITELTSESLAAFTIKYPDYPYLDEVKREFEAAVTRFYPVEQNGRWGFTDDYGKLAIECKYDWVEPFSENMASVGLNDEVIFINKAGEVVIDQGLEDAYSFRSGYVVVMKNDKSGVMNRLGAWVIEPLYDEVGEFSEGLFYALKNGLYGYLNPTGDITIPFKFENATDFKNGKAVVETEKGVGIINTIGIAISTFNYEWIEPLQLASLPSRFRTGDLYGLINRNGQEVVEAIYTRIGDWSEGLAYAESNGKYGFISGAGDTIVDFTFAASSDALKLSKFEGGYAKVYQSSGVGVIDTSGAKLFPAIFQDIGLFNGGLIPVKKRNKWGYSDLEVNLAIPYKFDYAENFIDSTAIVMQNGKHGLIGVDGAFVIDPVYNTAAKCGDYFLVSDTAFGMIDIAGVEKVQLIYSKAERIDNRVIRFERYNGAYDYFDFQAQRFIWKSIKD